MATTNGRVITFQNSPLALTIAVLALTMLPAHAADITTEDLLALPLEDLMQIDFTVASLLPTNEREAGSTVAAISQADWQRRGARRMLDAVRDLPATMVLPVSAGSETVAFRGYARGNVTGIGVLWDSVPLNDISLGSGLFNTPTINLGALKDIQVIQGPGSALYGSDAFHGVLALQSFESSQDIKDTQGQLGSDGYYDAAAHFSTEAYDGARMNLALAANGQPDQHRAFSYADPTTGEPHSGERANEYGAETATLKLISDPTEPFSYRLGLYAHHYDAENFPGFGTRAVGTRDQSGQEADLAMARLALTRTWLPTRSLELSIFNWNVDSELVTNLQGQTGPTIRHVPNSDYRRGVQAVYRDALATNTRWALSAGADQLGQEYSRTIIHSEQGELLSDSLKTDLSKRSIHYVALDANTQWAEGRLRAVYGARFDRYSDAGNHTSPRLGLIYLPQPDTAVKLLYGHAFRAPNAVEFYGSPGFAVGNSELAPEVIDTYELVWIKSAPPWRTNWELFRSLWNNSIVFVANPNAPPPRRAVNQGNNDAIGTSGRLSYQAPTWVADVGGSYVMSENSDSGESYKMFPKFILTLGVGYTFTQSNWQMYLNQRLHFDADDVSSDAAGFAAQELPTYWRMDLTATKQIDDRFDLLLAIRNLLDRNNKLPSPNGSRGGIPDDPLSVSVGMRYGL